MDATPSFGVTMISEVPSNPQIQVTVAPVAMVRIQSFLFELF